jgi:hypothetical protein
MTVIFLNSNHFLHPLVLGLFLLEPEITSAGSVFTIGTAKDANEEQQCVNVRNKILDPARKDAIRQTKSNILTTIPSRPSTSIFQLVVVAKGGNDVLIGGN